MLLLWLSLLFIVRRRQAFILDAALCSCLPSAPPEIWRRIKYLSVLQDPPYSTGTDPEFDVDLEPKLDDSVLQWDDEMEDNTTLTALELSPREPKLAVCIG